MPSTGPQLIGDATVQHIDNSDIFDGPGPTSSSAPPPIEDPHEDLGASNSDDDSLPSLGDPKPEFFGETTPPSISLIGAAAFKRLIDVGEEVVKNGFSDPTKVQEGRDPPRKDIINRC